MQDTEQWEKELPLRRTVERTVMELWCESDFTIPDPSDVETRLRELAAGGKIRPSIAGTITLKGILEAFDQIGYDFSEWARVKKPRPQKKASLPRCNAIEEPDSAQNVRECP